MTTTTMRWSSGMMTSPLCRRRCLFRERGCRGWREPFRLAFSLVLHFPLRIRFFDEDLPTLPPSLASREVTQGVTKGTPDNAADICHQTASGIACAAHRNFALTSTLGERQRTPAGAKAVNFLRDRVREDHLTVGVVALSLRHQLPP